MKVDIFIGEVYEEQFYNYTMSEGFGSVNAVSPEEMAEEKLDDNFAAYAYWRSSIDKYKIYRNLANESLQDLKERTK